MMVVEKAFRGICGILDMAVYQCIDWFYQLFMMLAETGIFRSGDIRNFADRMYFFLGLIMIFKVSISIIQYIMNPDSVKDNKVGAPKLLKNVVIILIGIVLIPYVFEAAYSLQRIVLRDNVIGSLILGMNYSEGEDTKSYIDNAGNRMAFSTLTAFLHYDTNYISEDCSNNPFDFDASGNAIISSACTNDANHTAIDEFMKSNGGLRYKESHEEQNMLKLLNGNVYNYTIKFNDEDEFLFSYSIFITTLAGGFLAYILLLFCFDIAVRSVKLGFLQLIAPIPLIAKIDPKKGDEVFNKWVKECISTYLMLFIRLVAIYFAIFIISIIGNGMFNVVDPTKKWNNPFVFVFIIFGTLLFVKDLPKLIETITGMKLGDGKGALNLAKKIGGVPLAGNMLGNTSRKLIGGIDAKRNGKSFKSGWDKAKANDKGFIANLRKFDAGMRPYSAETKKKRIEGQEEFGAIHGKWKKGEEKRKTLDKEGLKFADFKGRHGEHGREPYKLVYKNEEFIESLMNLDTQDDVDKKIRALYSEAQTLGSDWKGGEIKNAKGDTVKYNASNIKELAEAVDTSAKTIKGLQDVHDTMRKKYSNDATVQDAIKFNKYNPDDPTDPNSNSSNKNKSEETTVVPTENSSNGSSNVTSESTSNSRPQNFQSEEEQIREVARIAADTIQAEFNKNNVRPPVDYGDNPDE